jgi:hypothetical protein
VEDHLVQGHPGQHTETCVKKKDKKEREGGKKEEREKGKKEKRIAGWECLAANLSLKGPGVYVAQW